MNTIQIASKIQNTTVHFQSLTKDYLRFIFSSSTVLIVDKYFLTNAPTDLKNSILSHPHILLEATEAAKTLANIELYAKKVLNFSPDKNTQLLAIGGGITLDFTGLLASLLFRGIAWSSIPTTILAQTDSCIGGKTAVNIDGFKNILGAFYPPSNVYIDTDLLCTLSENEIHSGLGEIIKALLLDGLTTFTKYKEQIETLILSPKDTKNQSALVQLIHLSLLIKKQYIEQDEFDKNQRQLLNFGHTFGHAIEKASQHKIPHGIAVSMGVVLATKLAIFKHALPTSYLDAILPTLKKLIAPYETVSLDEKDFFAALRTDKKNIEQKVTFILPCNENAQIQKVPTLITDELYTFCRNSLPQLK